MIKNVIIQYQLIKNKTEDYNIEFYKNNKQRDECFDIVYNTEKEMNNEQFIAKIKGFDPTAEMNDIENIFYT